MATDAGSGAELNVVTVQSVPPWHCESVMSPSPGEVPNWKSTAVMDESEKPGANVRVTVTLFWT